MKNYIMCCSQFLIRKMKENGQDLISKSARFGMMTVTFRKNAGDEKIKSLLKNIPGIVRIEIKKDTFEVLLSEGEK